LGGGTFDVSVLKIKEGCDFDVLAVAGDTHLGGVDFDNMLFAHCSEEFERKHKINLNDRALQRLQVACERAKITLSQFEEAPIDLICIQDRLDFTTKIKRSQFEHMCDPLFKRTLKYVNKALNDANLKPAKIDEIILIGGSTRIPKVRELLRKHFGDKILNHSVHSDEAVAKGAAIQAAILSGAYCHSFGQLKDVNPLSLGVCDGLDRKMSIIIPRNTRTPYKNVLELKTLDDFQTRQDIEVYEGEGAYVADNILLRKFALHNLTPAKKGKITIEVKFELDENETLKVKATEVKNPTNTESIQVTNISGHLSKDTIDRMINDAGKSYQLDEDRLSCIKLRNQIANYTSDSFEKLAGMDNIETSFIREITNEFAMKTKWLESNPQASLSETQQIFDELKKHFNQKLKERKLTIIQNWYKDFLQQQIERGNTMHENTRNTAMPMSNQYN
jgi:heat shock 70kDa protein 1/2/6/8